MYYSTCLDEYCRYRVAYYASSTAVMCRGCGQTHDVENFIDKVPLNDAPNKMQCLIKSLLFEHQTPKRGPDTVSLNCFN